MLLKRLLNKIFRSIKNVHDYFVLITENVFLFFNKMSSPQDAKQITNKAIKDAELTPAQEQLAGDFLAKSVTYLSLSSLLNNEFMDSKPLHDLFPAFSIDAIKVIDGNKTRVKFTFCYAKKFNQYLPYKIYKLDVKSRMSDVVEDVETNFDMKQIDGLTSAAETTPLAAMPIAIANDDTAGEHAKKILLLISYIGDKFLNSAYQPQGASTGKVAFRLLTEFVNLDEKQNKIYINHITLDLRDRGQKLNFHTFQIDKSLRLHVTPYYGKEKEELDLKGKPTGKWVRSNIFGTANGIRTSTTKIQSPKAQPKQ